MFPNTCWFIPSKNHAFWRSVILWTGEGWGRDDLCQPLWYLPKTKDLQSAVRIKFSGFTKPHQTLQFPVETIHSFVSFFGLPKISQDISRSWSNGLMAKLFTNVYLFFLSISICQWLSKPTFLPSGKLSHNYGKIHHAFFMGKLTISTGPFSIANCWHNQRVPRLVTIGTPPTGGLGCILAISSVRWQLRKLRLRIRRRRVCAATDSRYLEENTDRWLDLEGWPWWIYKLWQCEFHWILTCETWDNRWRHFQGIPNVWGLQSWFTEKIIAPFFWSKRLHVRLSEPSCETFKGI